MNKLKVWLCMRFLPAWCKDELLEENTRLRRELTEAQQENKRLRAYIDGVHTALRYKGVRRE